MPKRQSKPKAKAATTKKMELQVFRRALKTEGSREQKRMYRNASRALKHEWSEEWKKTKVFDGNVSKKLASLADGQRASSKRKWLTKVRILQKEGWSKNNPDPEAKKAAMALIERAREKGQSKTCKKRGVAVYQVSSSEEEDYQVAVKTISSTRKKTQNDDDVARDASQRQNRSRSRSNRSRSSSNRSRSGSSSSRSSSSRSRSSRSRANSSSSNSSRSRSNRSRSSSSRTRNSTPKPRSTKTMAASSVGKKTQTQPKELLAALVLQMTAESLISPTLPHLAAYTDSLSKGVASLQALTRQVSAQFTNGEEMTKTLKKLEKFVGEFKPVVERCQRVHHAATV